MLSHVVPFPTIDNLRCEDWSFPSYKTKFLSKCHRFTNSAGYGVSAQKRLPFYIALNILKLLPHTNLGAIMGSKNIHVNMWLYNTSIHSSLIKTELYFRVFTKTNDMYCTRTHMYLLYKGVSKSSRTVLVKRSLLTLDVKFFHHLQSNPLLHEYSGPSVSAMLGSIPGSPFLELCQVPAVIPLESLQGCRIFDPSSEASAWGRGKSHKGPDRVRMGDGGPLSCCS